MTHVPTHRRHVHPRWHNRLFGSRNGRRIAGDVISLYDEDEGVVLWTPEVLDVGCRFQRLIQNGPPSQKELLELTPRQFEEFIAEIWSRFGYKVELTKHTRDGGFDICAIKKAEADVRFLIECKRYEPSRKVDIAIVRALYSVRLTEHASKAILATTSSFTNIARRYFDEHIWELEPRDYDGIVEWVKLAGVLPATGA